MTLAHADNELQSSNSLYSQSPYGDFQSRRAECLGYGSRQENQFYGEVAKMALDLWAEVNPIVILAEIENANKDGSGRALSLTGLLALMYRFGDHPNFPADLTDRLMEAALNFDYSSIMAGSADFFTESEQLHLLACEILAGQLYPDLTFSRGRTGAQIREHGEQAVLQWMQERAAVGFSEWDAPATYAEVLTALSLLVDLAESEPVWELASVLMDKLFYALSINSFRGTFATARRRADSWTARSGLMDPTSGVIRLMWGMGIFNFHLAAPVSLALLENYELPPIFAQIATLIDFHWSRESHAGGTRRVNKVSYRTKDYMLSSAQDYFPGEAGDQEQVWLATLGPNALVYTNHPAYSVDQEGLTPGYWVGNRSLPRIAQWKDVLIALYRLPEDDDLGYTHVYFPMSNFDEWILRDGWAFARVSDGYLALTASTGINLAHDEQSVFHELRAPGNEVAWVCHMGSAWESGSFAAFQEKILGLKISFEGSSVSLTNLRGEALAFSWDRPFTLEGVKLILSGFPHYESRYCTAPLPCEHMEIRTDDYLLRLDFASSGDITE